MRTATVRTLCSGLVRGLVLCGLVVSLGGCARGPEKTPFDYFPNMRYSVPYDAFAPNPVFRDGKTLQRPAAGTIARGWMPFPYGPGAEEADRAGRELENPVLLTPRALGRGRHLYETFCAVCHGASGQGDGPLIPKFPPPPAYDSDALRELPAGRLFHAVTWGTALMPGYRVQIAPRDRWHLIHYVQTLQRGEGALQGAVR